MKLGIACDHSALELKKYLISSFPHITWVDLGCHSTDSTDYPDYAKELCTQLKNSTFDLGVLLCGTGIGMSIAANRFKNIRAALCHNVFTAKMCRNHNNANVLVMGARILSQEEATDILKSFLTEVFEAGRHEKRLLKIDAIGC